VFVHGEIWRARTDDPPLHAGETVRVDAVAEGLVLEVSRAGTPVSVTA
jgi:membrane protein implicated in regulation of membrane protease activity